MKIRKSYFWILLILIFSCFYTYYFISSYPQVLYLTDHQNYLLVFSGEGEDTGFYPLFIALKEIFRFFSIDYSVFQHLVGISFVASYIFFFRYLYSNVFSLTFVELLTVCAFVLFSYPFVKSFSLVKSFLSLSSLLVVFVVSESCPISRPLGAVLPIVPSLFSPISLPFTLLFYIPLIGKLKYFLFSLFTRWRPLTLKLNLPKSSLSRRNLYAFGWFFGLLFIAIQLITRSIIFDQRSLTDSLPLVYELFVDKFLVYIGASNFVLLAFASLGLLSFLPLSIGILGIIFAYSVLVGFGRVSIFIPFILPFLCKYFPSYKPFLRLLLFAYMFFCVNRGLVLLGDL